MALHVFSWNLCVFPLPKCWKLEKWNESVTIFVIFIKIIRQTEESSLFNNSPLSANPSIFRKNLLTPKTVSLGKIYSFNQKANDTCENMERVAQYFFAKIINWVKEKNGNILKNNSKWNIKPSWQLTVFLVNITYPRYRLWSFKRTV